VLNCHQAVNPAAEALLAGRAKTAITSRLRQIEGQVGGLIRIVDEDRYCVDVLTQINAVRAALHKVEGVALRRWRLRIRRRC
jgi:DNA-binding FrmR family transcriptional regulator